MSDPNQVELERARRRLVDHRIPIFVDYGGPSPDIDPKTQVFVNFIEPPIPDALLEQIAAEPCLRRTESQDCPPCQASIELEQRHATRE